MEERLLLTIVGGAWGSDIVKHENVDVDADDTENCPIEGFLPSPCPATGIPSRRCQGTLIASGLI